jgi:hypothetical protein
MIGFEEYSHEIYEQTMAVLKHRRLEPGFDPEVIQAEYDALTVYQGHGMDGRNQYKEAGIEGEIHAYQVFLLRRSIDQTPGLADGWIMQETEKTRVIDRIPFEFSPEAFRSEIRFDAYPDLSGELERYLGAALTAVHPRALFRVVYLGGRDGDRLEMSGEWFQSKVLSRNLEGINRVFAYCASCGPELYSLNLDGFDPFASYWHDTLKTQVLTAAVDYLGELLKNEFGIAGMSTMNPGSGNADVWPIRQQRELFSLLGDTEELIGVHLTKSFLMVPDKSVSGIFFPSETAYINCQSCTREICPNRHAPYRQQA